MPLHKKDLRAWPIYLPIFLYLSSITWCLLTKTLVCGGKDSWQWDLDFINLNFFELFRLGRISTQSLQLLLRRQHTKSTLYHWATVHQFLALVTPTVAFDDGINANLSIPSATDLFKYWALLHIWLYVKI